MLRHYKKDECLPLQTKEDNIQYKTFTQYTNIESLFSILRTKTLRFSRLDDVNDLIERKQFEDEKFANLLYVSCFTYRTNEYIPLWMMYTKLHYGTSITFKVKGESNFDESIIDRTKDMIGEYADGSSKSLSDILGESIEPIVDTKCISYENNAISSNADLGKMDPNNSGVIKSSAWDFEEEARLRLLLNIKEDCCKDLDFKCIYVPIDFTLIEELIITFSPWMPTSLKEDIKNFCKLYLKGINYKIKDSVLENALIRK